MRHGPGAVLTAALLGLAPTPGPTLPPDDAGQVQVGDFRIDRYEYPNAAGQLPRVDVSWEEAGRLCAERGARLCTEEEWERACRGPEGHAFGYGPRFAPGRCNTPYRQGDTWVRDRGPQPSGAFPDCTNAYGVVDMIGNVWEWTDGYYDETHGWRVVRGGSWFHSVNFARADGRYGRALTSTYRLDLIGFRCCWSAPAGD